MKKIIILFTILLIYKSGISQNNSYFNDFFDNSIFNSAYNSTYQGFKFSFVGYNNSTLSNSPGYFCINSSYTNKDYMSIGARLINKNLGLQKFYQGEIVLNKRMALSKNDSLSFALSFGGAINSYSSGMFNSFTEIDPQIDTLTKPFFTSGTGLLFTHKNDYEIGISAPILATSNQGLSPMTYINFGYNFKFDDFVFKPQLIHEINQYTNVTDISGMLKYKKLYWVKFSYMTNKVSTFGIGARYKNIDVGYAYRLNTRSYGQNIGGFHNLIISMYM